MRIRLTLFASLLVLTALSPASGVMFRPTDFLKVPGAPFELSVAPDSAPASESLRRLRAALKAAKGDVALVDPEAGSCGSTGAGVCDDGSEDRGSR